MADANHEKLLQCTWINLQIPLLGTTTVWVSRVMWGWWSQHLTGKMHVLALRWSPLEQLLSVWCQWTSYLLILLGRNGNMAFMDLIVKDRSAQAIGSLEKQSLCTVWKDGDPKDSPFLSLSSPRSHRHCSLPALSKSLSMLFWANNISLSDVSLSVY